MMRDGSTFLSVMQLLFRTIDKLLLVCECVCVCRGKVREFRNPVTVETMLFLRVLHRWSREFGKKNFVNSRSIKIMILVLVLKRQGHFVQKTFVTVYIFLYSILSLC